MFSYVFDIAKSHEIFESSLEYEGNEYDCLLILNITFGMFLMLRF
jgi:hypothetical protein